MTRESQRQELLEAKIRVNTCDQKPQVLLCLMMKSNGKIIEHRTCDVEGCCKRHIARGWCYKHYKRWQEHGNPMTVLEKDYSHMMGNSFKRTHGMTETRFFSVWREMKARCHRKANKSYGRYGGRGITVCERWHTFQNFMDDMYESYLEHKVQNKHTTIERKDNDRGYSPNNCKWATYSEQNRNKRNSPQLSC